MVFVLATIAIIYIVMGIAIVSGKLPGSGPGRQGPPIVMGWLFTVFGTIILLVGWSLAACLVAGGVCLWRRKAYLFCCVVGGMSCIWAPLGTALGVCSLIVLMRPSVKDLFTGRIVERDPYDEDDRDEVVPPPADDRPAPVKQPTVDDGRFTAP